jgi:lipid-A-disaccharide synthase
MKIFLLAGEASGDLHGSHLVSELKSQQPEWEIVAWGGPLMKKAGARLLSDYRTRAFMGLWEVLKNLRTLRRFLQEAIQDIEREKPDALVFIDNPGFNMRVLKRLVGFKGQIHYYIAPKAWAWNEKRAKELTNLTALYGILPFEAEWFAQRGVNCTYIGNPLMDQIPPQESKPAPILALLPGSRKQEVESLLPLMIESAKAMPELTPIVAGTSALPKSLYEKLLSDSGIECRMDQTYDLLHQAQLALVTSGTATLETALFGVPQVVLYRTSALTYWAAKWLIKVPYISLVNLVAQSEIVPELIQGNCQVGTIQAALKRLKPEGQGWRKQKQDYAVLRDCLGEPGVNKRLADSILQALSLPHER